MVAAIDIGSARNNVLSSMDLIGNEIQLAECPCPQLKELVTDVAVFLAEDPWQKKTRKVQDHEENENKQRPDEIQLEE